MTSTTERERPQRLGVANCDGDAAGGGGRYSLSITTLDTPLTTHNRGEPLYDYHQTMTKCYPDKVVWYKFKEMLQRRRPGFEVPQKTSDKELTPQEKEQHKERSLRRSRQKLRDLTDCNDFDKFATFTFDPSKHDAYNYTECKRKMTKWLNKQQERHGKFRYIIVSELMKDGKIHFHALLGDFTGKYHKTRSRGSKNTLRQCYKIDSWEKNYGFADMEDISDKSRIANYIGKYISKDFNEKAPNEKRYWASQALNTPIVRYDDELAKLIKQNSVELANLTHYENDHCEIVTLPLK